MIFLNLKSEMIKSEIDYLDLAGLFGKPITWVQNRMLGKTILSI